MPALVVLRLPRRMESSDCPSLGSGRPAHRSACPSESPPLHLAVRRAQGLTCGTGAPQAEGVGAPRAGAAAPLPPAALPPPVCPGPHQPRAGKTRRVGKDGQGSSGRRPVLCPSFARRSVPGRPPPRRGRLRPGELCVGVGVVCRPGPQIASCSLVRGL